MPTAEVKGKCLNVSAEDSLAFDAKDRSVKVNGTTAIILLILAGVLWFGVKLIDRWSGTALEVQTKTMSDQHAVLSTQHEEMIRTQQRIADTLEVQTFLMTKGDDERRSYQLDMPDTLKKKQAK